MLEILAESKLPFDIYHRGELCSVAHLNVSFLLGAGSGRRSRVNNEEPKQPGKPTSVSNNNHNNNNNGNGKAKSIEK